MAAAAHSPEFAKKMNIPQSVAKDFNRADAAKSRDSDGGQSSKADRHMPHHVRYGGRK